MKPPKNVAPLYKPPQNNKPIFLKSPFLLRSRTTGLDKNIVCIAAGLIGIDSVPDFVQYLVYLACYLIHRSRLRAPIWVTGVWRPTLFAEQRSGATLVWDDQKQKIRVQSQIETHFVTMKSLPGPVGGMASKR